MKNALLAQKLKFSVYTGQIHRGRAHCIQASPHSSINLPKLWLERTTVNRGEKWWFKPISFHHSPFQKKVCHFWV